MIAWRMVMRRNVCASHSVKGGRIVVCLNKAVGITGVKCAALSAVLFGLGDINSDSLGYMR